MLKDLDLERELFLALERVDKATMEEVAAGGCPWCGGRLHRGDFPRKPRGALIAPAGEEWLRRYSLCCGREGCRKRATPPSVRFLGRRVYLGVVVIVASMVALTIRGAGEVRRQTGVAARTAARWVGWWQGSFLGTEVFVRLCAQLIGIEVEQVPTSIVERLGGTWTERVRRMLAWLAPLTTGTVPDGARFLRGAA
jgi:hypothetical protein